MFAESTAFRSLLPHHIRSASRRHDNIARIGAHQLPRQYDELHHQRGRLLP